MSNYYGILGVTKNANEKDIRSAYRKLARKYHPDLNPGSKESADKFKKVNEAYEILSDSKSREKYDLYGEKWKHSDGLDSPFGGERHPRYTKSNFQNHENLFGSSGFSNLEDLFNKSQRTSELETSIEVTLEEAYSGTNRTVKINVGTSERRIEVTIPPGVDTGSVVKVSPNRNQKILLNIIVTPHKFFSRKGNDLTAKVEIPLEDVVLGGEVEVKTLKSRIQLKVPRESQNGQRIRLKGHGMPKIKDRNRTGDLYVEIQSIIPNNMSDEEIDLFKKLKQLRARKA